MRRGRFVAALVSLSLVAFAWGCGDDDPAGGGSSGDEDATSGDVMEGDGGDQPDGSGGSCEPTNNGDEICDGKDNDCDGETDECCETYYKDKDEDGYGTEDETTDACAKPEDYVEQSGDCDDLDSAINPDAEEKCDGVDNDCDGETDEEGENTYYEDVDEDGYGNPESSTKACTAPDGFVENDGDCDDMDASVNPGQEEICGDGKDNDCDGMTDEECGPGTCYFDEDGDGWGISSDTKPCDEAGSDYVDKSGDCLDTDAQVNPGQTKYFETQNANGDFDYNCDGNDEKKWQSTNDVCNAVGRNCNTVSGWQGNSAPDCGNTGQYLTSCQQSGTGTGLTCEAMYSERTQKCR